MSRPARIRDEDLLDAARAVFLERGILATTSEVAARAGVSEGTLFKRFGSKTRLFHQAIRTDEIARAYTRAVLEGGAELSGEGWLRLFVAATLRFMHELVPIVLVAGGGGAEPNPDMRGSDPPPVQTRRPLAAEMQRRMKAGELVSRDALLVTEVVFGSCWHEVHMAHAMPDVPRARTDEAFVDGLAELLWSSLDPALHTRKSTATKRHLPHRSPFRPAHPGLTWGCYERSAMKMSECSVKISALLLALSFARRAEALQPLEAFVVAAQGFAVDIAEASSVSAQREAEADSAVWKLAPTLQAQATFTRNQYEAAARIPAGPNGEVREALITPQNQRDLVFRADLPLVDLGSWARVEASSATAGAARERRTKTRSDVARKVADAWFSAAAAEGLLEATTRAVEAARESLRIVTLKREAGRASELDTKRAEAEIENRLGAVADARLSLLTARRRLTTLSGVVPLSGAPELPTDDPAESSLASWEARATDTPELRAARADERAADKSRDAIRAGALPTLSAFAQEKFTNAVGFGQQPFYAVGLVATWKLDGSLVPQSRAQSAALDIARVRSRRVLEEARDSVHDAWQSVEARREKRRSAAASLDASRVALALSRERYAAGQGTLLDVSLSERDVLAAEAALVDASARLGLARLDLRLVAGLPPADAISDARLQGGAR